MSLQEEVMKRLETPGLLDDFLRQDQNPENRVAEILQQIQKAVQDPTLETPQILQRLKKELTAEIQEKVE